MTDKDGVGPERAIQNKTGDDVEDDENFSVGEIRTNRETAT